MSERPDQRYPLTWPTGWPRTPRYAREASNFKVTPDKAFRELLAELDRLGASKVVISSNLKLRQDGYPYANQPRHDDEGIAVYFQRKGKDVVMACDKFARREHNMRAITKTIDALRGMERWGASDMMDRAFSGFIALPAPPDWRKILGFGPEAHPNREQVDTAYRRRASELHPDRAGDGYHDAMADLNAARDQARLELES